MYALEPLKLSSDGSRMVSGLVEVCELSCNSTYQEASNSPLWRLAQSSSYKVSNSRNALWIRFNYWDTSEAKTYLTALSPNVDSIEVYSSSSKIGMSGDNIRFSQRSVKDAYPTVILPNSDSVQMITLKIRMSEDFIVPLYLKNESSYQKSYINRQLRMGIYIGVMLSICLYNLFLFFSTKYRLFLLYSIYVFFVALTQLSIFSDISGLLYPESLFWLERDIFIFSSLLGLAIGPLILKFLSVREHSLMLFNVIVMLTFCYGILFTLSTTKENLNFIAVLSSINLLSAVFLLVLSFWLFKREVLAKYFLVAWSTFLVGSILFILQNLELIEFSTSANATMTVGTAMEAILLSFALGHHFNSLVKSNRIKESKISEQSSKLVDLDKQLTKVKLRYLRGRMNPHFLFNALTSIQNFILKNDKLTSADFVAKYAKIIRENFIQTENSYISLDNEKKALDKYLRIERLRSTDFFNYKVEFKVSDDIDLKAIYIPPLLIQPLVENAVKHAFIDLSYAGLVLVELNLDFTHKIASVIVKDNGKGSLYNSSNKNPLSRGLSIVNERLSMLGKLYENEFVGTEVVSNNEQGYEVKIKLPLINKYED
ncbi:MAG: histidine kinase [Bacteroidia bacterium]